PLLAADADEQVLVAVVVIVGRGGGEAKLPRAEDLALSQDQVPVGVRPVVPQDEALIVQHLRIPWVPEEEIEPPVAIEVPPDEGSPMAQPILESGLQSDVGEDDADGSGAGRLGRAIPLHRQRHAGHVGHVEVAGYIAKERLCSIGRVAGASCEAEEHAFTLSGVAAGIAFLWWWAKSLSCQRNRKPCESDRDQKETVPQGTRAQRRFYRRGCVG